MQMPYTLLGRGSTNYNPLITALQPTESPGPYSQAPLEGNARWCYPHLVALSAMPTAQANGVASGCHLLLNSPSPDSQSSPVVPPPASHSWLSHQEACIEAPPLLIVSCGIVGLRWTPAFLPAPFLPHFCSLGPSVAIFPHFKNYNIWFILLYTALGIVWKATYLIFFFKVKFSYHGNSNL